MRSEVMVWEVTGAAGRQGACTAIWLACMSGGSACGMPVTSVGRHGVRL